MAYTSTSAATYARIALLKQNVRAVLRNAAKLDEETVSTLLLGIEQKWIKSVHAYGISESTGEYEEELRFSIDWDKHQAFIHNRQGSVTVDLADWSDGVSPIVRRAIEIFNDVAASLHLKVEGAVTYTDSVWYDERMRQKAQSTLKTLPANPRTWRKDPYELPETTLSQLEEASIKLLFKPDE